MIRDKKFEDYIDFSNTRVNLLDTRVREIESLNDKLKSLAIFICGSYGRNEAHENSDLDPFFVNVDLSTKDNGNDVAAYKNTDSNLSNLDLLVFWGDFIRILRDLGFPELSKDGIYLKVPKLSDIEEKLGGPEDDYRNYLTTRMLLLLESKPIGNRDIYLKLIDIVIGFYFQDYHKHLSDFRPTYLLNDISLYWHTMCMNYEYYRKKRKLEQSTDDLEAQDFLKNIKLRFSRKLICYSMTIPLSARDNCKPSDVKDLVTKTPLERIASMEKNENNGTTISRIEESYLNFLNEVSDNDIIEKVKDREFRHTLKDISGEFQTAINHLSNDTRSEINKKYE